MMHHLGHQDNTGGVVVAVSCCRPAMSLDGGHWWWWWKVMEASSLVLVVSRKIYKINLLVKQNKKKWKKKHTKAQTMH